MPRLCVLVKLACCVYICFLIALIITKHTTVFQVALLAKEDEIEADFEKQVSYSARP